MFSSWAKDKLETRSNLGYASSKGASLLGDRAFMVDNSELKSSSSGLRYRNSKNDEDKNRKLKPVHWGSVVWGVVEDEVWLKVKERRYLPLCTPDGVQVLSALATPSKRPPQEEDEEEDEGIDAKGNAGTETLGALKVLSVIRFDDEIPVEPGAGTLYEVVADRAVIRTGPSLGAPVLSSLKRGKEVELFEWDATRLWRRCLDPGVLLSGWMLLDHPELGPLLRPLGRPLCVRPLDPLCTAAAEGRLADLRRFLAEAAAGPAGQAGVQQFISDSADAEGCTPLLLAASCGQLECCVRLLEARANPADALADALEKKKEIEGLVFALLAAAAGRRVDPTVLNSAMHCLAKEELQVAKSLLPHLPEIERGSFSMKEHHVFSRKEEDEEALLEQTLREVEAEHELPEIEMEAEPKLPEQPLEQEDPPTVDLHEKLSMRNDDALDEQDSVSPLQSPGAKAAQEAGVTYVVSYASVWIRREPHPKAAQITKRMQGEMIEILGFDDTGAWGRVSVRTGSDANLSYVDGWMLLRHDQLGQLLTPLVDVGEGGD